MDGIPEVKFVQANRSAAWRQTGIANLIVKPTGNILHDIVNIQEFHLNYRFKESCKTDMETFCAETASKDIGEMVLCLSSINREDTVENEGKAHRISSACRKQLRSELLRRAEKIELDPAIAEACRDDIPKVCPKVMVQGNLLECLRTKTKDELSAKCHAKVFKVEMVQAADEYADFALVKVCRRMIKKYCPDEEGHKLLPCLIAVKKEPDMDPKCAKMIKTRQMEEAKDVRLNPSLYKGCHEDLRKFCSAELTSLDNLKAEAAEIEAKVLNCLRKNKKKLSDTCTKEITHVEKEVVLDYKMDPHLADVCKSDIAQCKDDDEDEKGKVVECLKNLMKAHKLKDSKCALEISRLVADGKADIHVDPNLYMACQLDLKKLCFQILPGEGRQFQCLVDAMDDNHKLGQVCATKLKERIDFVKYASEIEPIENMEQLVESVMESHAKYYFLSVMGGALCAVLCIGICCGRATKRIRRDLKNR